MLAALLEVAGRWRRWAVFALLAPWCLLQYGNYEHVRELGAGLQLTS